MTDTVLVAVDDGIATLTLNRPDRLNAWDTPMREKVAAALGELNEDAAVRAVVLTGAGDRAFSAGQDLEETMQFSSGEEGRQWFMSWRGFYDAVRHLDKGCVAALNGVAAGSAYQFAMLADVRVGHPGTTMGQPEINSGIPSVLGPLLMLPRIGLSRTIELTLTGRMMGGDECHHIGLIHHLVDRNQVMSKAREVAALLASKPPGAMRLNKRRFREITEPAFEEAFATGHDIEAEAFESGEPQRAMEDFFAQRAAKK
ncbi:MAG: enoyl-CoA hydratase/isomerase family protein [Gammaproteobacteria bacterium]|nr:enoyl-CoA hydratase/isomerase family protein [Gammaproteobacteria bacterium]